MSPSRVARAILPAVMVGAALAGFATPATAQDTFSKADLYTLLRESVPQQVCKTAPHVFAEPFGLDQARCEALLLQSLNFCIAFNDGTCPRRSRPRKRPAPCRTASGSAPAVRT